MGQKVNPHGLRVGVIMDWDTRWYAKKKDYADNLIEDYELRTFLKKKLKDAQISKIEIEKTAGRIRVNLFTGKPGMVIGRSGAGVEEVKKDVERITGKAASINIIEIHVPELDAQLVADDIADKLAKRTSFRRAMKMAIQRTMKAGAKGIKTNAAGRLGGAEIARTEHYHEGSIPLQTLRANIDYGFSEAHTTMGRIGVKVWIYKGEVMPGQKVQDLPRPTAPQQRRRNDGPRPPRDNRDNRGPRPGNRPNQNGPRRTEGGAR